MKRFAVLLAACIVLSGCFGGGKDKDDEPTPTSSSSTSTTGAPSPGLITASLERSTPNGAVPLTVNLTVNATFQPTGAAPLLGPPAGASWNLTIVALGNLTGNATGNATGDSTAGPTGSSLPANATLNLTEAGTYRIELWVSAPGYAPGNASVVVLANATGGAGGGVVFFEGGEADESQWELSTNVLLTNFSPGGPVPSEAEFPEEHPDGPWAITDAGAHTGTHAWAHPYPDNYRTRMTSVPFTVPAGGATLSYWYKGGMEGTSVEGMFVLAGPADALVDLAHHSGASVDWTEGAADLAQFAGQEIVLQFRIDSDSACSNDTPPADPGGLCGAGYDAGGFYLDDITVA